MTNAETILHIRALRLLGQAEELERKILQRAGTFDYDGGRDELALPCVLLGLEPELA